MQQIARGLVLPFTVFFSWWLLGARSSRATLIAVFIVCIGFVLGVSGEIHTTALGTALGVASSVTTAVHAIVVKRSLSVVSGTLDLAYFSNLLSAFVILPFVFVSGEVFTVIEMFSEGGEGAEAVSTFLTGALVTVSRFVLCLFASYELSLGGTDLTLGFATNRVSLGS
jgi:GDP-fucose transporter C1